MIIKLAETQNELQQIIELQEANHTNNVSLDVKEKEGFVTVKHDIETLKEMNNVANHVIAVEAGFVVGYALVMLKEFKEKVPVLIPMFDSFEKINFKHKKITEYHYYVMGQICIKDSHRGKGIFKQLYFKHKAYYSNQFEICLTEVSTKNHRSMNAHKSVGFQVVKTFSDETDEWNILLWDLRNS